LAYCDVMHPTKSDAFTVFKSTPALRTEAIHATDKLEHINVVQTFLPLLMARRIRCPEDGLKYLEMVRLCEVFAFRVNRLRESRADAGQKTTFRVANELFRDPISVDEASRQLRSELLAYSPNHSFADRFKLNDEENNWY